MSNWILLRGLMREQRHWGDFPAILAQALPGAAILTPDLPGNGLRYREASASSVRVMVEACRRQLQAQRVAPPYRLLALSLGGMVALEWASRYPQELAGCVLINTSMRPYSRFYQRLRWHNYPALLRQLWRGDAASQEALILRLTSNLHGADDALLQCWIACQQQYPVRRANVLRQLWAAARYRAPAQRPALPLLVLAGGADRLVDPRCSQQLAARWGLPCLQHPAAGHDLPLDAPHWVAQQVAQWLASAAGR